MTTEATITVRSKIDLIAARENSRYATNGVRVTPSAESGACWLSATDGRMLAITKAPMEGALPNPAQVIPSESVKSATSVTLNGQVQSLKGTRKAPRVELRDYIEGSFPPFAFVLDEVDDSVRWVTLNAAMLADLAKGLGDGSVSLGIREPITRHGAPRPAPILVIGRNGEGYPAPGLGVLMPVASPDDPAAHWNRIRAEYLADHPLDKAE